MNLTKNKQLQTTIYVKLNHKVDVDSVPSPHLRALFSQPKAQEKTVFGYNQVRKGFWSKNYFLS